MRLINRSGHLFQRIFQRVVNLGKLGDSHHIEDLLEMIRDACDSNRLFVFLRPCQNLNQNGDTTAVDICIGAKLQQDSGGSLVAGRLLSFVKVWFRKGGNISLDVHNRNRIAFFKLDFVNFWHLPTRTFSSHHRRPRSGRRAALPYNGRLDRADI